jgi:hypothetical protein
MRMVEKRISGLNGDEMLGGWRKVYNKVLRSLHPPPPIVIRMFKLRIVRLEGHTVRMKKMNAYRILAGKPEGKRPFGRRKRRWDDNIKMELTEIGWGDVDWTHVDGDRDQWRALVNTEFWHILEQVENYWLLKKDSAPRSLQTRIGVSGGED